MVCHLVSKKKRKRERNKKMFPIPEFRNFGKRKGATTRVLTEFKTNTRDFLPYPTNKPPRWGFPSKLPSPIGEDLCKRKNQQQNPNFRVLHLLSLFFSPKEEEEKKKQKESAPKRKDLSKMAGKFCNSPNIQTPDSSHSSDRNSIKIFPPFPKGKGGKSYIPSEKFPSSLPPALYIPINFPRGECLARHPFSPQFSPPLSSLPHLNTACIIFQCFLQKKGRRKKKEKKKKGSQKRKQ